MSTHRKISGATIQAFNEALHTNALRRDAVLTKLNAIHGQVDIERQHEQADKALCDFLRVIGYGDVAEAFEKIPKWYA